MHNEKKHAYLILAHNNFSILKILLKLLDDPRNDLFIHIDKKVKAFDFDAYKRICSYSPVHFIVERIDIIWGRSSLIDAEMLLFEKAYTLGHYAYYHLISGVDLPIKTQDDIHDFFRGCSKSFIVYSDRNTEREYERLSLFCHIPAGGKALIKYEDYFRRLQRVFKVNRFKKWERKGYTFEKGANWVSLTHEAVETLINEKETIKKMTRYSHCADEVYKQIILKKAGVPVYHDPDGKTKSLRLTDWSRGDGSHPYVFRMCDYDLIFQSNGLFARKFDQDIDFQIVEAIYHKLKREDDSDVPQDTDKLLKE